MNKKFKKIITASLFAIMFLFGATSCNNKTKYLDGDLCGTAEVGGTNVFSQVREFYCEEFVFYNNYNLVTSDDAYKEYEFTTIYETKFFLNEGVLDEVTKDEAEYGQAHYLYTYYTQDNKAIVDSYITNYFASDSTKANKYIEVVDLCANQERYGYFDKIQTLSYDGDQYSKDGTKTSVSTQMTSHSKACLVFGDQQMVDPGTGSVILQEIKWKDVWSKSNGGGLLVGLFVYPMAWLINLFVNWFGGASSGWGQVGAILVVTILIKLIISLLTFKSQRSTQKMQDIQPEILKIQAKYGQNPTPEQKQRMSMELMAVYQKYGVKPLAPFASMLITFPVFIAMYRSVMYLAVLRTGNIAGVTLGHNLNLYFINQNYWGVPATITAVIIFILMAASQILSMKLPQIMNRKRMTREAKQQQKQMGMMSNVMMIMILVMGFMMPVTMSIYWIASAIVSIIQSIVMHKLNNSSKTGRYKVKKAESDPITIPQGYKK